MDLQEKLAWLRLIRSQNIGPILFWNLLRLYGTAQKALKHIPHLASGKRLELCSTEQAEAEFYRHEKLKFFLLARDDPEFPPLLKSLPDCPPLISVGGNTALLHSSLFAMVGSRNASLNNCRFAHRLATELGQGGLVIVSGLARGIDRHAHEGALHTGTIAILAGGVDQIYPPEHQNLYQKIREQGVLMSEMPLGFSAGAMHFPRRNRLVSGVSRGVLVVEAALKSGSMITARCANEQNREVFAIPGSPLDPRCRGGNRLLKDGAYLVETSEDILHTLMQFSPPSPLSEGVDQEEPVYLDTETDCSTLLHILLNDIDSTPLPIDQLRRKHNVSPGLFTLVLVELELSGFIRQLPNQTVIRLMA